MIRLCFRTRRDVNYPCQNYLLRSLSNSSKEPQLVPFPSPPPSPPPPIRQEPLSFLSRTNKNSSLLSPKTILALSATLLSAAIATVALLPADDVPRSNPKPNGWYTSIEHTIHRTNESFERLFHHVTHTGVAATVLWQSLSSVLSTANHEVRVGFELRVAALLADIAAANASRRAALVGAGNGAVVDWLLETVVFPGDGAGPQAEAARALAYLIADPNVSKDVLGRPNAVPNLLRFIFSCQPNSKKHSRRSSFDVSDSLKGRSMLVAAIMDIVTSSCDSIEKLSAMPLLPGNAQTRDIAAAIQVIEEGSMHFDEPNKNDDDDGGSGIKGIGIKILEGTTVLGISRNSGLMELYESESKPLSHTPKKRALLNKYEYDSSRSQANLSSAVIPGLWDDLHCQHVAVPFAAWALANWAMASGNNRSLIKELDQDGYAVMTSLMAPERSVKWHGSLVARLLLEDRNLPLTDSVSDWSSSLLATVSHASKNEDISLAQVALSAFLISVDRSQGAQQMVMEKGLHLMRDAAKQTRKHKQVQESLAKALEFLSAGDMRLSLEEGEKWSGILLYWLVGKFASETTQLSATRILSHILEDYGPSSVPISQGWLAILLHEVLEFSKTSSVKGGSEPRKDGVKTQISQSTFLSAAQVSNQLAGAVVNLAATQVGTSTDSLVELLSLEPFVEPLTNMKNDSIPKLDAADSALATLKGIKALTEVCAEDSLSQSKIVDFGILCLLRRFLLRDDFEKLAAIEAYDASSENPGQSSAEPNSQPSVRVPASAHIRRHAARLLMILSLLPKAQKVIASDETWCRWLEECATGKIHGCNDLKLQSYARATLLNVFCNQKNSNSGNSTVSETGISNRNSTCPGYGDMLYLINPGLTHWKCPEENKASSQEKGSSFSKADSMESGSSGTATKASHPDAPQLDVVFVHGLRGGPYKTWRIAEDKSSTKSGLVEKIDQEAGKMGTFWPGEWLSNDFPDARLFTLKYKTNLTEWTGASLPLQEVSSLLLQKLISAGIGDRPVVFVTHSMGGLVVKQILHKAKAENLDKLVNNTAGVVFYSCPHFGSKLADMPWRMGLVLRPAPSIGELRSGSPKLVELNDFIRRLHRKKLLDVLSFCETKVTPIVEGYGGWALRMEIVPIESAYPGFGNLIVLESTDHINSCKPLSRSDPSYKETLEFLLKIRSRYA